jgi:hypothetical protein
MRKVVTIELSKEISLEVEGHYYPEEPMVWTLPNGDPGYPGSPAELVINSIKIIKGTLLDLIDNLNGNLDLWNYLTELAIKQIEENGNTL